MIGFSVHDTIVVFDRVREKIVQPAGEPFEDVMNHSLTQTWPLASIRRSRCC